MRVLHVFVTQEHIDEGECNSCTSCPVALALRDLGPENSYLVNYAALMNIHMEKVAGLPAQAISFISAFDHCHNVEPFDFYVQIDR